MESTPLVLAHSHARSASIETQKANPTAASEEHDLAAGEFANAAKATNDTEALRTLKLLEQYHQKLAELLKFRPQTATPSPLNASPSSSQQEPSSPTHPPPPSIFESSPRHVPQQPTQLIQTPHRELSSSIASNLASARGIPSNRQRRGNQIPTSLSPQLAEGRIKNPRRVSKLSEHELSAADITDNFSPPLSRRTSALSPSRARVSSPDINPTSPARSPVNLQAAAPQEDSFSRFYTMFEPLLSKLSAPLAFTGLPLNPADTPLTQNLSSSEKSPVVARITPPTIDPDLSRLFSRAALRALHSDHGIPTNAHESFYVVPTTGGTMSYANILTNTKHNSHLTASDDEFVDAREQPPQPGSPGFERFRVPPALIGSGASKDVVTGGQGETGTAKKAKEPAQLTEEELRLENRILRQATDKLSQRLQAFEMGAQRSSMALHMSYRAIQSPSASVAISPGKILPAEKTGGEPSPSSTNGEQESRVRELEEELRGTRKEMKRLVRENQKLVGVVERYRERWEMLKDGARERMRGDGREGEDKG
ncbi:hypothetical protein MMC19_004933 [Ptychographa xylographoides]|nr:hypothetical protein [Ptychographa xylographoides]